MDRPGSMLDCPSISFRQAIRWKLSISEIRLQKVSVAEYSFHLGDRRILPPANLINIADYCAQCFSRTPTQIVVAL